VLSPCGRLAIVGLCSDDSAGGVSLPRGGGFRCCELLPTSVETADDEGVDAAGGIDDEVADGVDALAGSGWGDEAAGGADDGAAAGGGDEAAGGGGALDVTAGGDGGPGGGSSGAEEIVAELLADKFDEPGELRVGGTGGGTVLAMSPARKLSALYCALLRSATKLFTSLSRSMPLNWVSGGAGTVPRLG
jgi:hypothetical protein